MGTSAGANRALRVAATVILSACLSSNLAAQTSETEGNRAVSLGIGLPNDQPWQGHIGAWVGLMPDYEGSNDTEAAIVLPMVDIAQRDFLFVRGAGINPNDGDASLGWQALNLVYAERGVRRFSLSVGPLIRFFRGRDQDANAALNQLGDIDDGISGGGFLQLRAGGWSADLSAVSREAGAAGGGLLVSLRTGYTVRLGPRLSITPGAYASWGDDDLMQGLFGISSTQAANSPHARFDADAGVKDVGITVRADYALGRHFLIRGEAGYQRLTGNAADSPLVDGAGSANQYRALLGLAYRF